MITNLNKEKADQDKEHIDNTIKLISNKNCHRCGGLMVSEHCYDIESPTGEFEILIRKCLSCGESIDPTILRNRQRAANNLQDHTQRSFPFTSLKLLCLGY